MAEQKIIPLLTDILPIYNGIYPAETVEVIYSYLKNRIETLTPIVEMSKGKPLVTAEERENHEKGESPREIALRSQNNEATVKALEDCQAAWERLINGTAHICTGTGCGRTIDKDRKQAYPQSNKCCECREKEWQSRNTERLYASQFP